MERAAVSASLSPAIVFRDGLGDRRQIPGSTAPEAIEQLCLRGELAEVPSFEFALRERVSRLASFRHAYFGHVRGVERSSDVEPSLIVSSDATQGVRLSELLRRVEERQIPLDINAALCLVRQLVPGVAMLHEHAGDVAHGALGPERLILTPGARLVIVEYVLGAALEQLRFSQERYWHELRIPLPRAVGLPRFDRRADVAQIGVVALSLILGRQLRDDEYPARISDVVASTWAVSPRGGFEPLPPGLRGWLGRALQLDARNALGSAIEARAELDKVLGDSDYIASPASLEAFLTKYHAADRSRPTVVAPPPIVPVPIVQAPAPVPPPVAAPPPPPASRIDLQVLADSVARTVPSVPRVVQPVPKPVQHVEPLPEPSVEGRPKSSKRIPMIVAAVAGILLLAGVGYFMMGRSSTAKPAGNTNTGSLVITTNPPGALTFIDGQSKGQTPLTLTLAAGAHTIELRGGGEPRTIPITVTAGMQFAQYVELPKAAAATGQLQVRSEPSGVKVTVDGVARGAAPLLLSDLKAGEHAVVLENDLGAVRHTVTIEPGNTATLVAPMTAPEGAPVSGWMAVTGPIPVQVYEKGKLLGSSQSDRIMVADGRHDLELTNDGLGFRTTKTINVPTGKVANLTFEVPMGTIALNAVPWAEVWIDGEKIGETPIGNHAVPIGSHDVVFRHPELGERHYTATVSLKAPARISVDLRKK